MATVLSRTATRAPVLGMAKRATPRSPLRVRDLVRATRIHQRNRALGNQWSVLPEWAPLLGSPPDPGSLMEAELIAALADTIGHSAKDYPYHAESPLFSARKWPERHEREGSARDNPTPAMTVRRQAALSHPRPVEDRMKMDIAEFDKKFVLKVDLPGTRREDIWLDVCEDVITIGGPGLKPSEEAFHTGADVVGAAEVKTASPDAKVGLVDTPEEDKEEGQTKTKATKAKDIPRRWLRLERPKSFKARAIRMPKECDMKSTTAAYRDGVLTVTFGKMPTTDPSHAHRHINID